MIRMTQTEFKYLQKRFEKRAAGLATPRAPRDKKRRQDLPENVLVAQIKGFLQIRGWTLTRNHVGLFVPFRILKDPKQNVIPIRVGETGMADWRAERPVKMMATCEVFYFETKAPGKKPRPDQLQWLDNKRVLGWTCNWFDGFNDGFDHDFLPWYSMRFK